MYDLLLEECGGPMLSQLVSNEPRNVKQIRNRQATKRAKSSTDEAVETDDLTKLLLSHKDPNNYVKTVTVTEDRYIAFFYSDKQISDLEFSCCTDDNASVLGIDTTFKLCDMWVTDTSYRNKRRISKHTRNHPVHIGPIMLHFTKDEKTFRRFSLKILSANPSLKILKNWE